MGSPTHTHPPPSEAGEERCALCHCTGADGFQWEISVLSFWFQKQNSCYIKSSSSFLPPCHPTPLCLSLGHTRHVSISSTGKSARAARGGESVFPSFYKNGRAAAVTRAALPLVMLFLNHSLLSPFSSSETAAQLIRWVCPLQNREVSLCRALS